MDLATASSENSITPPDSETPAPTSRPLRARLLGATLWVAVGAMGGHVMRLLANLLVTRLLVPEMFGVMAIAGTISVVLAMLSDIGLHQNIIRSKRGGEEVFLNTAWTAQIAKGFLMWLAAIGVALGLAAANRLGLVPAGSTYAAPVLPWIIVLASFSAVIIGFWSLNSTTATRNFDMRRVVMLELAQQLFGIFAMVAIAWATRSIWALVAAGLASQVFYLVASHWWLPGKPHRLAWDKGVVKELTSFGKWIFMSSALGVLASNSDRLLLAGVADAHYMGLYSVAFALVGALDMVIAKMFQTILLPAFSEVARQDPARVPNAFFRIRKVIDPIVLTASGAMFALAPLIIHALYDDRYITAGHILAVLSLGMTLSRYTMNQQAYIALDRPQYQVLLNAVRIVSAFLFIPLAYKAYGIEGALFAIALRELPILPFVFWFNARHKLNHFGLEVGFLAFWFVGYGLGTGLDRLVALATH